MVIAGVTWAVAVMVFPLSEGSKKGADAPGARSTTNE
jgi:hypothetical protein